MNGDLFFEQLGELCDQQGEHAPAPSTLKSRVFTALVRRQQQQQPLMTLSACRKAGETLCIFEQLVAIAPVGEPVKAKNPARSAMPVCWVRGSKMRPSGGPVVRTFSFRTGRVRTSAEIANHTEQVPEVHQGTADLRG